MATVKPCLVPTAASSRVSTDLLLRPLTLLTAGSRLKVSAQSIPTKSYHDTLQSSFSEECLSLSGRKQHLLYLLIVYCIINFLFHWLKSISSD
jgi:hypothetical protein